MPWVRLVHGMNDTLVLEQIQSGQRKNTVKSSHATRQPVLLLFTASSKYQDQFSNQACSRGTLISLPKLQILAYTFRNEHSPKTGPRLRANPSIPARQHEPPQNFRMAMQEYSFEVVTKCSAWDGYRGLDC
jgi:hypothetical protein